MRKIKSILKNKKGSMMMDYFIIAAVGVLLLGATMMFLTQGRNTIQTMMGRVNKDASQNQDSLGSFW